MGRKRKELKSDDRISISGNYKTMWDFKENVKKIPGSYKGKETKVKISPVVNKFFRIFNSHFDNTLKDEVYKTFMKKFVGEIKKGNVEELKRMDKLHV